MSVGPAAESGWPEWESFVRRHGYLPWLNLEVFDLESGRAVLAIEPDEDFENPVGTDGHDPVHGGIVATLLSRRRTSTSRICGRRPATCAPSRTCSGPAGRPASPT